MDPISNDIMTTTLNQQTDITNIPSIFIGKNTKKINYQITKLNDSVVINKHISSRKVTTKKEDGRLSNLTFDVYLFFQIITFAVICVFTIMLPLILLIELPIVVIVVASLLIGSAIVGILVWLSNCLTSHNNRDKKKQTSDENQLAEDRKNKLALDDIVKRANDFSNQWSMDEKTEYLFSLLTDLDDLECANYRRNDYDCAVLSGIEEVYKDINTSIHSNDRSDILMKVFKYALTLDNEINNSDTDEPSANTDEMNIASS